MNSQELIEALKELGKAKSLSEEVVGIALETAIARAYRKVLGGDLSEKEKQAAEAKGQAVLPDAEVRCEVNLEEGTISLYQIKKVVAEVEDDYIEIELEEANEGLKKAKYKVGDDYLVPADVADMNKAAAMAVKSNFRQALADAERSELYKVFKDHIGEMMTGFVETANDKTVTAQVGRALVELTRKELIGDEYFKAGDPIKVYIQEVRTEGNNESAKKRGPQIEATRASEGFLKRLFEEEIHEIYDGTVLIKGLSRKAGIRSKIAVVSMNEDVDATGACIGQGGSRIQKIVAQLGNGHVKEKIDIIEWSEFDPLFIMNSVRPCEAMGIYFPDPEMTANGTLRKKAMVVLSHSAYEAQHNRYRENLPLASKLTGYAVSLADQEEVEAKGQPYMTKSEAELKAKEIVEARKKEEFFRRSQEEAKRREAEEAARLAAEEAKRLAEEEAKAAALEAAKKEEAAPKKARKAEPLPENPVAPKAYVSPEEFPAEAMNPAAAALAAMKSGAKPAAEEEKPEEAAPRVEPEVTSVKTTTTIADLEAELAGSKKGAGKAAPGKTHRPRKITEEEVKREAAPRVPSEGGMAIYTEEELKQIEEEDRASEADNIPYDDYDEDYDDDYGDYDSDDNR